MRQQSMMVIKALVVLLIAAGCGAPGGSSPTPAAVLPSPAKTQVQPTPTIKAIESTPPVPLQLVDIPGQSFAEGEERIALDLTSFISADVHNAQELSWNISESSQLIAEIRDCVLVIALPDDGWQGSEMLTIEACGPDGSCDQTTVEVSRAVQDKPPRMMGFGEQVAFLGEAFRPIDLDERIVDTDSGPGELSWTAAGGEHLQIEVQDGTLHVTPVDGDWIGSEAIQLEVCDAEGLCSSSEVVYSVQEKAEAGITYIINEGFLIEAGGKKILVDGLFDDVGELEFPATAHSSIMNGRPPFDNIDLMLTTHSHADHFEPRITGEFLSRNPGVYFISTPQAVSAIKANYEDFEQIQDQLTGVYPDREASELVVENGIEVEIFNLPHGNYPNLGFLFDIGGIRMLHTGDFFTEDTGAGVEILRDYHIPEKEIDIALVAWALVRFEESQDMVLEGIQPEVIIPMHYVASQSVILTETIRSRFPDSILFTDEMQKVDLVFPN